uniref:Uncharacterized protein n=1 Tax=Aegilops tauschii subsp. strangulata TaxID=200361 RepID=A0A453HYL7_AEGTS
MIIISKLDNWTTSAGGQQQQHFLMHYSYRLLYLKASMNSPNSTVRRKLIRIGSSEEYLARTRRGSSEDRAGQRG